MREIKFRGLRTLNGEWVYGNLLIKQADSPVPETSEPYKCYYIVPIDGLDYYEHEIDPDTIGQYTGAKDSKGKEIYEGDLVFVQGLPLGDKISKVEYIERGGAFFCVSSLSREYLFVARTRGVVNVIGNIHDNPELLER